MRHLAFDADQAKFNRLVQSCKGLRNQIVKCDAERRTLIKELEELLAIGQRSQAAELARSIASTDRLGRLEISPADEVVRVLADSIDGQGDRRKRGRPKMPPSPLRRKARAVYYAAIISRHLIDGDELEAIDLLFFYSYTKAEGAGQQRTIDTATLREFYLPYAKKILAALNLKQVPRQKFRGETLLRCAKKYQLSENVLAREIGKKTFNLPERLDELLQ